MACDQSGLPQVAAIASILPTFGRYAVKPDGLSNDDVAADDADNGLYHLMSPHTQKGNLDP
jgi:hypothetical protein